MDKIEIEKFIQEAIKFSSETSNVEFKDARGGFPRSAWKSVSSFSHKPGGGIIVFGIVENRDQKNIEIMGVNSIADLQERLSNLVSNEMSFTLRPEYHITELDGKNLLVAYIPECPDQFKPCYYKPAGMPNGACIRDGNTDRKMTDEEMRKLIENSKKFKFDNLQAKEISLDDISKEKVLDLLIRSGKRTRRNSSLDDISFELLKNLGIADESKGLRFPTVAGFLIFAKGIPQDRHDFSRYKVRCIKYKGSNVATDIIDNMDVEGTLDVQIDIIMKFILRNIRKSAQIIGTKRVDKYEYPEKAIREIVANAIIHRDYRITETYTQVNLFDDRLEIFNPGCLPPGVTIENIKDSQVSRNEIIAARLKDLDYLEEYGRGIDIVFNSMKEWELLPPLFKNTANSFKVTLIGEKFSGLNERQVKIWEYLAENKKITVKLCEDVLRGVPRSTINYDLRKLQEVGLIKSIGESIGRYYEAIF